jgi:hypothetical protein
MVSPSQHAAKAGRLAGKTDPAGKILDPDARREEDSGISDPAALAYDRTSCRRTNDIETFRTPFCIN